MNLKKLIALDNPLRLLYHKIRAILANFYYGFPSKNMKIIWVTWTNWKTSTCNIIAKGLMENSQQVFMFTTVNIIMWDQQYVNETKMTSPDVFYLQSLLKKAQKKWIKTAIIETASHWIKMHRIWGLNYDTVILTNITQDHLDLHKTMDDYVKTKLEIFKNLISYKRKKWIKKTAIINIDSDYHKTFEEETFDSLYRYWKDNRANIKIWEIKNSKSWLEFKLKVPWKDLNLKTKLKWEFNAYNIAAWVSCFISEWIKSEKIEEIVKKLETIPGRLEEVETNSSYKIFIDYAHTPDALENVIETLNKIKKEWKLTVVFWATGDRDKSKRPIMWQIVSKLADKIILTQDDDYTENTISIIKDILPTIQRKQWDGFWVIPNREEAIRTAIIWAEDNEIILIAGKWDEHSLITNSWPIKWHDKTIVENILKNIDNSNIIK